MAVALKVGVTCKSCGGVIEIEDEYVRGIRPIEMATVLYAGFHEPAGEEAADVKIAWRKTLTCEKSDCRKTHSYRSEDLLLFDG